jgi:hypothetical protein
MAGTLVWQEVQSVHHVVLLHFVKQVLKTKKLPPNNRKKLFKFLIKYP